MKKEILLDYIKENTVNNNVKNIEDTFSIIELIKNKGLKGDFLSLIILYYIKNYIAPIKVNDLMELENFLAILYNGITKDIPPIKILEKDEIDNYINKNNNKKTDILINDYRLSIKSLLLNNKELNIGSFSKEALFKDIFIGNIAERKGVDGKHALGSKQKMFNLFNSINNDNKWAILNDRFKYMVDNIYNEDFILLIRNESDIEFYFLENKYFRESLCNSIKDINNSVSIINRIEGNSLRVHRKLITENQNVKKIKIYFNEFDFLILDKLNNDIDKYSIKLLNKYKNLINV